MKLRPGKLPDAVVLIQQRGRPVYLKNFGVQDVETKVPMLVQTQNERGRILPAFRKLVYDAFATGK